ncbi:MAG TPA: 3-deoxy-manno-octulosonate cytidylyltransferase [Blastocatellia bacterium]|jgi:3-deoxy-manno-octulosonate cytidylyltransferase (CMP-KDO synthetase)|nr:3-deoxy-manno-octulosonate cytidylyltransferase [Blastocatellia bacterium]
MGHNVVAIIPARYASTRLPGKPLIEIAGKPMILRVVERAMRAASINRVIVATDDDRVFQVVAGAGVEAVMTSPDHATGTDRLAEVAANLDAEIIVNIQGDEPMIEPSTIESAITPLLADNSIVMSTTCEPVESVEDALKSSVVKVVIDRDGFALCFSRNPIPFPRAAVLEHGSIEAALRARPEMLKAFNKHTGLYAYRRDFLLTYAKLPPTPLEQSEMLEQLRALEHGYRIKVVSVSHRSIGVDTPEDVKLVRRMIGGAAG